MITRIDIGLSLLNKRFKQVDKCIKAKVVFHDGSVDIWLFYKALFFSRKVGAIHSSGFDFVSPKTIGLKNKDMEFIYQMIHDFQREYLRGDLMITPHQLDLRSSNMAHLYQLLEGELIRLMAKRLNSDHAGILEWQREKLQELHLFNKDATKAIS